MLTDTYNLNLITILRGSFTLLLVIDIKKDFEQIHILV